MNSRPSTVAATEAERAVDKVLAAHRLQEAVMDLNRASERAKLFRETTAALLPEFAHLLKHEGGRNEIE